MYTIHVQRSFTAQHALRLYDGSIEPMHSHDWLVHISIQCAALDRIDVVMDFHELEALLENILKPLHSQVLNDLPSFSTVNPSAERVAQHIFTQLHPTLPQRVSLIDVTVTESPDCRASYAAPAR